MVGGNLQFELNYFDKKRVTCTSIPFWYLRKVNHIYCYEFSFKTWNKRTYLYIMLVSFAERKHFGLL